MPKVSIYTQAYNTRPYLDQCVSSVLSQTYTDFEYLLLDNGCTDGSSEILAGYAKRDPRIRLIKFEKNQRGQRINLTAKYAVGKYYAVLDSDDWWEPDYLERLIGFLETRDLDLAVTGTIQYFETTHTNQIMRKLERPVVLTQKQFADQYPMLWTFPSTNWATVMKMDTFHRIAASIESLPKYGYGGDTTAMLEYIKQCSRIGIDNSALYHYRIHPKGVSYQYNPRRFDANIAVYEQIKGFLELHHTFDHQKQKWLKQVHLTSMTATLQLLKGAKIPGDEKAAECARIAAHPLTAAALSSDCDEQKQWYTLMREIVFYELSANTLSDDESLRTVLKTLSPHCHDVVQPGNLGLFAREPSVRDALQKDDRSRLAELMIRLIAQKKYTKQYDLGGTLCRLIPDSSPLRGISDTRFFREYARACSLVLQEDYSSALDQMTGLLFEKKKLYDCERFLKLYLSVAALENHAPAFVFGKLRLAQMYFRQNRREECRSAVEELTEMGVDNEELTALRQELEGTP